MEAHILANIGKRPVIQVALFYASVMLFWFTLLLVILM